MSYRVAITGVGVVAPGGVGKEAFWDVLANGRSCACPVSRFDAGNHKVGIACEIKGFRVDQYGLDGETDGADLVTQYALVATRLALQDAGLARSDVEPSKIGVTIGTSAAGLEEAGHLFYDCEAASAMQPAERFDLLPRLPGSIARAAGRLAGAAGPCELISTGCASGADAIGVAFERIRAGRLAIALAGGSEASIEPLTLYAFDVIGALSRRNADPQHASRPFDRERDGFVLGEGSGMLLLEEMEHAKARGARIYGELVAYETTCDAYHMTASLPDNREAVRGIRLALRQAGLQPEEIDYVCAHGTSTPMNDSSETDIIKQAFGAHARALAVSSIKSMIGHSSGAAGSHQGVACALALERQMLPPTINYEHPDPECDLDYVPNVARACRVRAILQNTFGFCGKNAALIYRRCD